ASPKPTGTVAERPEALEDAVQRWEDAEIESYTMTLQRVCFCMVPDFTGPYDVTVRDGEVTSVVLEGESVDLDRAETVDGLFELLSNAYSSRAESVEVEFDPAYGFPANLSIDYDSMLADEEIGYLVTDMRPLD
ncbi:DUF6174 domain-containing protein, partial [Rubrivirga sp.]|uniref:DUF6174 domain-containing protein n=1 Tax=Rubrivirga sp. TaxID=1885344 RepID=UPI003C734D81